MKTSGPKTWAAACLWAIVASCSGASSSKTDGTAPFLLPDVANPVDATLTAESENAVSATFAGTGGTLSTTGSDGTVYTLAIPENAVSAPASITMTPIRSVSGVDFFTGRWIGVRLEPEGLRFDAPVTLRMTPPEGERVHVFGFSAAGDGRELHGYPVTPDISRLQMQLLHFSSYGGRICSGDCAARSLDTPLPHTPSDWEARLQNYLEWLIRSERERQLRGQPSDPTVWAQIEAVLQEYWKRVIEPMLPRLMTDCSFAETDLWRTVSFAHDVEVLGFDGKFAAQLSQVKLTAMAALRNCFSQTAQPCIDPTNEAQMTKLFTYTHHYAMLNGGEVPFNPLDPDLQCGRIWTGTSRVKFVFGPETYEIASASFVFEVDPAASTRDVQVLRVKSGSVTWELKVTDTCTVRGGPQPFMLRPEEGEIRVVSSGTTATFSAFGQIFRPNAGNVVSICEGHADWGTVDVNAAWLDVPEGTPVVEGRGAMSGSISSGESTSEWTLQR